MGRAKLTNPRARKVYPCERMVEGVSHDIPVGALYWSVSVFRRRPRRFCEAHKPTETELRGMAPQSRSDRASDAASGLTDAASTLRELGERATTAADDDSLSADDYAAEVADIVKELEQVSVDFSGVEELAEEIRSWADNMEEHFGSTSKYEEVSSAADELEGIDTDDSIPSLEAGASRDDLRAFAEEADSAADRLESSASEVESVSFPTMY